MINPLANPVDGIIVVDDYYALIAYKNRLTAIAKIAMVFFMINKPYPHPSPPQPALWFSSPNTWLLELVTVAHVPHVILDIEHGIFDLGATDTFICLAQSRGFQIHAKTLAPAMSPIQQMLDLGADSVIIPHIEDLEHARDVCGYAKFAPVGKRSFAGGRTTGYDAPSPDYFEKQNRETRCYPMIETEGALRDVADILALDCVDGVFIGPSDLSLSRKRGRYVFGKEDEADIIAIADAARAAEKPWIMPAWRTGEQALSRHLGAKIMAVAEEQDILKTGLDTLLKRAEITASG